MKVKNWKRKIAAGMLSAGLMVPGIANADPVTIANAGFDSGTANWLDGPGGLLAGNVGGNGWTASYFTGGFPTNNTFATTISDTTNGGTKAIGAVVRQNLASTFVAGTTYTLSADFFTTDNYANLWNASIAWTIGLAADGTQVSLDSWYSEDVVGAPPGKIITTTQGVGTGANNRSLVYVATAADAGKTIGVLLGGPNASGGTFTSGSRYGFMDNIALDAAAIPEPSSLILLGSFSAVGLLRRRRK